MKAATSLANAAGPTPSTFERWPAIEQRPMPDLSRGLCRLHPNPELWWSGQPADVERATTICAPCPVREPCLAWALGSDAKGTCNAPEGTWGGLSEQERRKLRRRPATKGAALGRINLESKGGLHEGNHCA